MLWAFQIELGRALAWSIVGLHQVGSMAELHNLERVESA